MHRARLPETVARATITKTIIILYNVRGGRVGTLHRPKHILLFQNISWFFFPPVRLPAARFKYSSIARAVVGTAIILTLWCMPIDVGIYLNTSLHAEYRVRCPLAALRSHTQHIHVPRRAVTVL